MADIRLARRLRRWFTARHIGVFVQFLMAASIAFDRSGIGGTVTFFQSRTQIGNSVLALGFLLGGLISLLARNIRVYLIVNLFIFGSYALVGLWGWLFENAVPPQASIMTLGVCLYTLWAFPDEERDV